MAKARSLSQFQKAFSDEASWVAFLFKRRWPDGFVCPVCGKRRVAGLKSRPRLYQCLDCGRQTSITAGPCSISCSKTASTAVSFRLSMFGSPWLCGNSMEYQCGSPLPGLAPAEACGRNRSRISRRQVTVPLLKMGQTDHGLKTGLFTIDSLRPATSRSAGSCGFR
jgi:hypothetical protein